MSLKEEGTGQECGPATAGSRPMAFPGGGAWKRTLARENNASEANRNLGCFR